ncbi:uncharacterized protein LOC116769226 [Danaus plexippus]|uniref:Uncharacterized protein n=1 Tax=Danaus plexippus plexippus TaxID=278856 RepID=A0A212ERE6_DANPL|nr:uncharacterized protein LOC116769226 [Danaus plexippus]OWR44072.1 hypothetical protein KGM_204122 [Danaus plexippus plexippus]
MRLLEVMTIFLHLSSVHSKKKYKVRSSESIENILYYQDCNHKKSTEAPVMLRGAPQQQECKMCCTMCCGDQCVNTNQLPMGRQAQSVNIEPKVQPILPTMQPRGRRNKIKPLLKEMPQPKRRGLSFTRENIKSLISNDDDIRKILKDLVRVTMQKVDLMELINSRRKMDNDPEPKPDSEDSENDL